MRTPSADHPFSCRKCSLLFCATVLLSCSSCPNEPGADGGFTADAGQSPADGGTDAGELDAGAGCDAYRDTDCPRCDPSKGLLAPVPVCSVANPCTRLLGSYTAQGIQQLVTASDPPLCRTRFSTAAMGITGCVRGGRGTFDDSATGSPHSWTDANGTQRYWCEARPPGAPSSPKLPLLIYVPGSGGSAGDIYDYTLLRAKSETYDLGAGAVGFVLAAVQGRNLRWPTLDPQEGTKHDSYHRELATNPDVAFFDYLIDSLVGQGVVDPKRIYLTGWSNGARFSTFYGIARHQTPTAGGNRVAALAVYSGGDPYENISATETPSCKADPYPTSSVPYLDITRNCDAVACDQAQYDALNTGNWIMTRGNQATGWFADLRSKIGDSNAQWITLGYYGNVVSACLPTSGVPTPCTQAMAKRNHFCWPDGIADTGGRDHELVLLDFLKAQPLP